MSLESDIKESKRVVEPVDDEDCAVFFEPLANDAKRTVVNLQCSHRFHLDCVGSFFNIKNKMECPCCRQIEKGKWLFAKPVDLDPPYRDIDVLRDQLERDDDILLDMPTRVESDGVPYFFHSDMDRILTNTGMLIPNVPSQITDNGNARINRWRESRNTTLDARMQRQIDEHVAIIVDSESRLHKMLCELYGCERSGGGGGENSGGEAVAEAGEAAEGAEMTEE
ncbi:unnamed protein product [Arabidopsis lyrata]|uniref:RING-type domain-containing protein n=1 Tax=Arabidopsis lyrata subsp. lyrata TaxID=81972 RepID=D7MV57_ARALL|nr:uncharacterized protein LOC9299313 [Arabidopsis lyrata subsp. lyrata]EFH39383.1 hypothetical protein ARALYDRAFT_358962 [Arabidopsis lyrata subsp. lyrata]CAH8276885.1 unnamed protein product [Arabidopsis lyrata]|eukprot:XP_002863124.1 uncharacterized protein LOC9299313 [Arabidopsis lyrata subsp. lyrata]